MFMRTNCVDIYSQGMHDRSMRSGTELAREIKLTDCSMAGNLSYRSSGVQIPRDICTRLKRFLFSAKCGWIIIAIIWKLLCSETDLSSILTIVVICENPVGEFRSTLSVAIDHMESSL